MKLGKRVARALNRSDAADASDGQTSRPGGQTSPPGGPGPGRPRRDTPVNIAGQLPLIHGPTLRLGIVVIVKDEAPYLDEWLCYHLALGVQHVFLYDNGSTDGTRQVLERYQNHGLVTVVDWPLPGSQTSAYSHALRLFGPSVDWLGFFDVDEFLVPIHDEDIPSVLARFPDAAILQVPRREFAFSGHRTPPAALTIEAYTGIAHTADRDTLPGPRVKSVVRPSGVFAVEIHAATLADRFPEGTDAQGRPSPTRSISARRLEDVIQLNHYYTRSFEEFEAKRFRGSATGRLPRPAIPFDVPTIDTDTRAHRFVERTQAMLARMRSLEPRPYTYGSELAFPDFPVFDDLGRFAEFGLANMAAGLTAAGRGPALRFANLWASVGFVADLSETGFQPGAGAFSGSLHGEALFAHMRGRVSASLVAEPTAEVSTFDATRGSLHVDARGGVVTPEDGRVVLEAGLEQDGRRRCAAFGFVLGCPAPVGVRVALAVDDIPADAVVIDLPAGEVLAGVIEVVARPRCLARVTVELESAAPQLRLADLFLVTYG